MVVGCDDVYRNIISRENFCDNLLYAEHGVLHFTIFITSVESCDYEIGEMRLNYITEPIRTEHLCVRKNGSMRIFCTPGVEESKIQHSDTVG